MNLRWTCAALAVPLLGLPPGAAAAPAAAAPSPAAQSGFIDGFVNARLAAAKVAPAPACADAAFVRRAFLDVIGTLPTADEARAFLADRSPDKRRALIDRLLGRPEFADYWALKWCDLLRVKSEFPINLWPNAVQAYSRWIRHAIATGLPYDQFARELLTASGSNFRVPQVNFYRAIQGDEPRAIAAAVALTFLGTRCESWPAARRDGLAAFFTRLKFKPTGEWKEEIVYVDLFDTAPAPGPAKLPAPRFPDDTPAAIPPDGDPRAALADWLTAPGNPWFAPAAANRVWAWLLGRGLVHEPDDFRPDNPPSHPELLARLAAELAAAKFDLKHLYRLILNSETYQRSAIPAPGAEPPPAELFAYYPLRRLDAEVLIDAICQITGTQEEYSSPIPEPFTFIPGSQRSIALADGSITSSFLELFGRPPRDTGREAERSNQPTAAQELHLLNSSHIRKKIEAGPRLRALTNSGQPPTAIVPELYLTILSRPPTAEEVAAIHDYGARAEAQGSAALVDLAWALLNSPEFLFRH